MENKFINGDCMHPEYGLPSYPDKFFDLAVVDPPYGIGRDGKRKSTSSSGGHKGFEFKGWDANTPNQTYFNELFRVSKNQIIWVLTIIHNTCYHQWAGYFGTKGKIYQ